MLSFKFNNVMQNQWEIFSLLDNSSRYNVIHEKCTECQRNDCLIKRVLNDPQITFIYYIAEKISIFYTFIIGTIVQSE